MGLIPTITVWQPWASLIAIGAKPDEFRTWRPPSRYWGTRVGIHAGARCIAGDDLLNLIRRLEAGDSATDGLIPELALPLLRQAQSNPSVLPASALLCTAVMGSPRRCSEITAGGDPLKWGWPMSAIKRFDPPAGMAGKQGWWFAKLPPQASGPTP